MSLSNHSGSPLQQGGQTILPPKSLKRRNLKHLTLGGGADGPSSSPSGPAPLSLAARPSPPNLSAGNPQSASSHPTSAVHTSASEVIVDKSGRKWLPAPSTKQLEADFSQLELGVEFKIEIKNADLVQLKALGSGNGGTVTKVMHIPTQKIMAKKTIRIDGQPEVRKQIVRELHIMHECDNDNIVDFYGAYVLEGDVVMCMEYMDCGSLDQISKKVGKIPEDVLGQITVSILHGLTYLYEEHRIIHRDVKPSNVLVNSKGQFKLCDFGVSREMINSIADTFVGTSTYMSPERIQGAPYTVKGDVWSLGLTLYELASGRFPFVNDNVGPEGILDLLQRIVNEPPPKLTAEEGFSPDFIKAVDDCLLKENVRPTPKELLSHPFIIHAIEHPADAKGWTRKIRRQMKEVKK